jgi:starch-binding outer membrane protein SusE/F
MKKWLNILLVIGLALQVFTACKKDETKVMYNSGKTPALTASATSLMLVPADSIRDAVRFSWSDPEYAFSNGPATLEVTYTLDIDSSGRNFTKAESLNLTGVLEKKYTVKEFNALLIKMGFKPDSTYSIDVRLSSALYWAGSKLVSNIVKMTVKPYSVKPTPKFPVPANLYLVGDATPGGWTNPVPVPAQQLTQIDEFTFGAIVQLTGGKHYLLLPNNGSWDKYAVADNAIPSTKDGGDLVVNGGEDIPSPDASGLYKIVVNFITGKYTVTPATAADMPPANLYIVGDATPGGWTNPVPVPAQQFTQNTNAGFVLTLPLITGKNYLLLPTNGDWGHKYGVANNTLPEAKVSGALVVDGGQDFPSPAVSGTYKIEVEFVTKTYKLTKQ